MGVEGWITKERARQLLKLMFYIAETEHSFNTFGIVETSIYIAEFADIGDPGRVVSLIAASCQGSWDKLKLC